eukprot:1600678-Amphidinium_carterae.1
MTLFLFTFCGQRKVIGQVVPASSCSDWVVPAIAQPLAVKLPEIDILLAVLLDARSRLNGRAVAGSIQLYMSYTPCFAALSAIMRLQQQFPG